jgi:hypothetical protein
MAVGSAALFLMPLSTLPWSCTTSSKIKDLRQLPLIVKRPVAAIRKAKSSYVHESMRRLIESIQATGSPQGFHIIFRNCQQFCQTVLKANFFQCPSFPDPQPIVYNPLLGDSLSQYIEYISEGLRDDDMLDWIRWHSAGRPAAHLPADLGLPTPDAHTDIWFWLSAMVYCQLNMSYLASEEDYELRRLHRGTQALVIHRHLFGKQIYYDPPMIKLWKTAKRSVIKFRLLKWLILCCFMVLIVYHHPRLTVLCIVLFYLYNRFHSSSLKK